MRTAVLLLAVLVTLSGCGFLGGTGTSTPTASAPISTPGTGTPTDQTPTATATPTPEPGFDERQALERHQEALSSHSYRLRINTSGRLNAIYRETASANSYPLVTYIAYSNGSSRAYWARGETFGITNRTGIISFANSSIEGGTLIPAFFPGPGQPTPINSRLGTYLVSIEFTQAGTRTIDGTQYTVYEATSPDAMADRVDAYGLTNERNVTALDARLLVDDRNVIHSFTARYEYPNSTLRVNATVTDIGQVQVQQPDWLPEACRDTNFDGNISVNCERGLAN